MNPLMFGTSDRQLFGVFHPGNSANHSGIGVLLCPAFGQEYMRSHRAYRQLALMLSKQGHEVFRFDYYGTGDSSGDDSEILVSEAIKDVAAAAEEFRETTNFSKLVLVGLRLGASIALSYSATQSESISVILWDPVLNGETYLTEMLDNVPNLSTSNGETLNPNDNQQTWGFNGFPITPTMRGELRQLDLAKLSFSVPARLRVISSQDREEYSTFTYAMGANASVNLADYEHVPSHGDWNDIDDYGGALLHSEIIKKIVDWVGDE